MPIGTVDNDSARKSIVRACSGRSTPGVLMANRAKQHQHRHFKTLILLVISMTVGTFFLFWVDKVTPAHRRQTLQSLSAGSVGSWRDIAIRQSASQIQAGFFHFRIDESGRLYRRTKIWDAGPRDPRANGTIQIVLTRGPSGPASSAQQLTLRRLLDDLGRRHNIPVSRIQPDR